MLNSPKRLPPKLENKKIQKISSGRSNSKRKRTEVKYLDVGGMSDKENEK